MASSKKAMKKTYYPPKTFDDDLEGLVDLYETKGWSFSGVDLAALNAARGAFRDDKATMAQLDQLNHSRENIDKLEALSLPGLSFSQ